MAFNGICARSRIAAAVVWALAGYGMAFGEVVTWPAAPGTPCTNDYVLSVAGRNVDVMAVPKSTYYSEDKAFPYSYALFDADEEVLVEIRSPMDLSRARVLPQRSAARDIRAAKESFSFRAKPPFTLVVEPLRTRHRALIISASLPERKPPRAGDANVLYYGPGRHRLDGVLEVGSGQTLYLAPGAWLEGAIRAKGDNVTICGRGVISGLPWEHHKGPAHDMVNLSGKNVAIRDVTLMGSWFYTLALENVSGGLVENVKVMGGRCNNDDGIDPIAARDVTIRDCFVRTHDDCIAPKDWIENLLVERCCLWADGANTIRLGFECAGGPSKPFRNIRFRDIEILHLSMNNDKPPDAYWVEAAIHLQPSTGMVFEDIVFENFNFDFCPQAMDMLLVARTHPCRNGAPHPHKEGGHVRNVTFRTFNLPPRRPLGALGIWLQSIDPTHVLEDIAFENMSNFEVPVGIRGVVRNIRGLPRGIVRDETGSWRDYEAWRPYKTRIACIGDSITYGFGLKNRERDAYPAQLQRMLDEKFPGKYEVRNFGNPGRGVYTHTKFKGTCRAFASVPEHALALAWHPDIVICNLGANDWGEIGKEGDGRLAKGTFAREYHALLDEYRKLSTKPKIVIWTALAPLGKAHGARGKPCVETLNAELVRFAEKENLPGIDMRTPLADDIESLVLKDGIHPNPEGSRQIAETTFKALRLAPLDKSPRANWQSRGESNSCY